MAHTGGDTRHDGGLERISLLFRREEEGTNFSVLRKGPGIRVVMEE